MNTRLTSFDPSSLAKLASHVGDDWKAAAYYEEAEASVEKAWRTEVWPYIQGLDLRVTMDLAAGHGRNSAKLLPRVEKLYILDINKENIDFCRERFGDHARIHYILTPGFELKGVPDGELTMAFCYDAMVHFDSDIVRSYLAEFRRVLEPGGHAFCHHSNYTLNPCGDVHENPGWRNYMSKSLFAHYCHKEGLAVVRQELIRYDHTDCITVVRKD